MLLRYTLSLIVLAALSTACGAPAAAGVPSGPNSTVPPGFIACPWGDVGFTVVVRDIASNPVIGSVVELDFGACPSFPICEGCCPGVTVDLVNHRISKAADGNGIVTFALKMGGVCGGQHVLVRADQVLLASIPMASPDQDGDLYVSIQDRNTIIGKLGSPDPTADFDSDGLVTQADLDWAFPTHAGHSCNNDVLEMHRPTWGTVKLIYR